MEVQRVPTSNVFALFDCKTNPEKEKPLKTCAQRGNRHQEEDAEAEEKEPDGMHFEPIVQLNEVEIKTNMKESELLLLKIRGKLFRLDAEAKEWKEKVPVTVKYQFIKEKVVKPNFDEKRQDLEDLCQSLRQPTYVLKKILVPDRSWLYNVNLLMFLKVNPKNLTLAIRFGSKENAQKFKDAFEKG